MLKAVRKNLHFEIVPDRPEIGVYLYVYDGEQCIRDALQNDKETCKKIAFRDYGVPLDEWSEVEDSTGGTTSTD